MTRTHPCGCRSTPERCGAPGCPGRGCKPCWVRPRTRDGPSSWSALPRERASRSWPGSGSRSTPETTSRSPSPPTSTKGPFSCTPSSGPWRPSVSRRPTCRRASPARSRGCPPSSSRPWSASWRPAPGPSCSCSTTSTCCRTSPATTYCSRCATPRRPGARSSSSAGRARRRGWPAPGPRGACSRSPVTTCASPPMRRPNCTGGWRCPQQGRTPPTSSTARRAGPSPFT